MVLDFYREKGSTFPSPLVGFRYMLVSFYRFPFSSKKETHFIGDSNSRPRCQEGIAGPAEPPGRPERGDGSFILARPKHFQFLSICLHLPCHWLRLTRTQPYYRENHTSTTVNRKGFSLLLDAEIDIFCFLAHLGAALSCSRSNCVPTTIPSCGSDEAEEGYLFSSSPHTL